MKDSFFILVNKPYNISSNKFIHLFRKIYDKVGHTGTLDPFAVGLLTLGVNKATKFFRFLPKMKEYVFDIEFGFATDSYDLDGKIIEEDNIIPKEEDIRKILSKFIGKIDQIPNKFSAIKIDGVRAYKLAKKNIDFEIKKREVMVYELDLLNFKEKKACFRVKCGEGCYVRSLANDICSELMVLGCVTYLNRIMNHGFSLEGNIEYIAIDCLQNFYSSVYFLNEEILKLKNGVQLKDEEEYTKDIQCVFDKEDQFCGLILRDGGMIFPLCMI